MSSRVVRLAGVVDALRGIYGDIAAPQSTAFEMILIENAAYLVDDARRWQVFTELRDRIGVEPREILARPIEEIADAIAAGGMHPLRRAEKVREAAEVAEAIGLDALQEAIEADPPRARRLLKKFPGAGDPLADRILLFAGSEATLAPDSNALRVLTRLGFGREERSYSATYRSAVMATSGEIADVSQARSAHLLLRRHGQEICKRTSPRCEACTLRASCAWYRRAAI